LFQQQHKFKNVSAFAGEICKKTGNNVLHEIHELTLATFTIEFNTGVGNELQSVLLD
jgi:hypothetical protein